MALLMSHTAWGEQVSPALSPTSAGKPVIPSIAAPGSIADRMAATAIKCMQPAADCVSAQDPDRLKPPARLQDTPLAVQHLAEPAGSMQEAAEGSAPACLAGWAAKQAAAVGRTAGHGSEADSLDLGSRSSGAEPNRSKQREEMAELDRGAGHVLRCQGMAPELQAWYERCAHGPGTLTCSPTPFLGASSARRAHPASTSPAAM